MRPDSRYPTPPRWKLRERFGALFRGPARLLARHVFGVRLQLDPRLDASGPVIYAPNHPSVLDPILLFGHLPAGTWFAATEKMILRYPWLRVMKGLPIIFLPADGLTRREYAWMLSLAQAGRSLVIFPQADVVHPDEEPICFPGFGRIAHKVGLPVRLVAIHGTHEVFDWEHDRRIRRGRTVTVRWHADIEAARGPDAAQEGFLSMLANLSSRNPHNEAAH